MHDERSQIRKGKVLWIGGARLFRDGQEHPRKHVIVVEFEDTQATQEACNSGFAELEFVDDTVAVVLDSRPV